MNVLLAHQFSFEAAHRLPLLPAGHKCARLHGHSFGVEIAVQGPVDEQAGWLVDYDQIAAAWQPLYETLDHRYLNEIEGLENPTSENLAAWIWRRLKPRLPCLGRVTVRETCAARCEYEGE
ncbi:MAG: 6-carboxytetrahydropterin synthase QueD [Deltaproteobacteria bacterium]|nr:6-carboxytetrahydropterin synthase QueD [Deltaproteobacteria bacterium]